MRENRVNIFNLLKQEGKLEVLYVYQAQEQETDPYEHTKISIYNNPLPIKALVRQVSFSALHWKYFGLLPVGSIEIIAEKKYLTHFRTANKIKYGDNYYSTWKNDSQGFAILERPDYVIVVLAKKEI